MHGDFCCRPFVLHADGTLGVTLSAADIGDEDMMREGRRALERLAAEA